MCRTRISFLSVSIKKSVVSVMFKKVNTVYLCVVLCACFPDEAEVPPAPTSGECSR